MISEVDGDRFRIGIMQYGGYGKPKMEVELWEGTDATNLKRQIDAMRQVGGVKRMIGESLAVAGNKVGDHHVLLFFNTLLNRSNKILKGEF